MAQGRDFTNQFAAARCVFYDQNGKIELKIINQFHVWLDLWSLNKKTYWCVLRREFSEMIPVITSNNHPSNPQQPVHSLRLAPVRKAKLKSPPRIPFFLRFFLDFPLKPTSGLWFQPVDQLRFCGSRATPLKTNM